MPAKYQPAVPCLLCRYANFAPASVHDGDLSTFWASDPADTSAEPWISLRLTPNTRVGYVHIANLEAQYSIYHPYLFPFKTWVGSSFADRSSSAWQVRAYATHMPCICLNMTMNT